MATRVLLTVDTELAWRHYQRGADWRENFALSVEAADAGLSYQLDTLAHHDLKACFFVDPMPALVYGVEPIRRMVEPIIAAGQEVQLHLHSFWSDLAAARAAPRFELTDFDAAGQRALIATARDLLVSAGAPAPIAFRSGSYAADRATLAALRDLDIAYDSSHNGAEHPWPSALPFDPAQIDPVRCDGVTEIPVSVIRSRGALRPLQICALSHTEMRAALNHASAHGHPIVTIVSHSFELATRDGRRVNKLVRGRFESLCAMLAAEREALPTVRFADLDPVPAATTSEPMPGRRVQAAWRAAEQLWGDARYERPAVAATALVGLPLAAAEYLIIYGGS